jgi:hypothetical protein
MGLDGPMHLRTGEAAHCSSEDICYLRLPPVTTKAAGWYSSVVEDETTATTAAAANTQMNRIVGNYLCDRCYANDDSPDYASSSISPVMLVQ